MNKSNKGFVKTIVLIVIALIILGYYGYDVRNIIESESVQANLSYTWNLAVSFWDNYLERPVLYFWNNIFIDIILDFFIDNIENVEIESANTVETGTSTEE